MEQVYAGIYRAKVIDSGDPKYLGRVKVWIPDIMPEVEQTVGLWAKAANNPLGGRNYETGEEDQFFQGTCYIPPKGSYVYVFFEYGNPNEPRYLSSGEFGQTKVPIECQQGDEHWNKWIVFKSKQGRTVIISDDPHDSRVEITGKKRLLSSSDPSGNSDSVYKIDGNQTTILLDERDGNQKILIKDYKGNYLNFDIENETLNVNFKNDIHIKCGGSIFLDAGIDVNVSAGQNIAQTANVGSVDIKSAVSCNIQTVGMMNIKAATDLNIESDGILNQKSAIQINQDAPMLSSQSGLSSPANEAEAAPFSSPSGNRNDPPAVTRQEDSDPISVNQPPKTKIK